MSVCKEDIDLFQTLKEGNRNSLNIIFKKYYNTLLNFAKNYLHEGEAEEVVSDTFFQLWQKKDQIEIKTSLKGYLLIITRNKCLNQLKKNCIIHERLEDFSHNIPINSHLHPDEIMDFDETLNSFNTLIEKLPQKCKIIFKLSREQHLSHKEISEILDISVNTINTQMYRALKFLKEHYPIN